MKKSLIILLISAFLAASVLACANKESEKKDTGAEATESQDSTESIEYNTFDNNTSEEYVDPETGANLRDSTEEITEDPGVIPEEEEITEPEPEFIEEDTQPIEEDPGLIEEETTESAVLPL